MKKMHIVLLVLIAVAIAVLISFLKTTTTYDTVATAKSKPGKFVHLIAKLDNKQPLEYDALNNPNYLSFTVVDSLGGTVKVVYHSPKPDNLEHRFVDCPHSECNHSFFETGSAYLILKMSSAFLTVQHVTQKSVYRLRVA